MNKVMKNATKGFTLIEIIVVLVIIAILAAATVPSMIGFIEEANGKAYASNARAGLVAAQAVATQKIAGGASASSLDNITKIKEGGTFANMVRGVEGGADAFVAATVNDDGQVTSIRYEYNNYRVIITGGETKVERY